MLAVKKRAIIHKNNRESIMLGASERNPVWVPRLGAPYINIQNGGDRALGVSGLGKYLPKVKYFCILPDDELLLTASVQELWPRSLPSNRTATNKLHWGHFALMLLQLLYLFFVLFMCFVYLSVFSILFTVTCLLLYSILPQRECQTKFCCT